MAYLKGGTVVDGNLYIEGSLIVKSKEESGAAKPLYVKKGNNKLNHLTKFNSEDSELIYTLLKETIEGNVLTYSILGCDGTSTDNINEVILNIPVEKLYLKDYTIYAKDINGNKINYNEEGLPESLPDYFDFADETKVELTKAGNDYIIPEELVEVGKIANISGEEL